jgi:3-deoxy-D-manno-octulosonate 8-phosphate phosphatase (KDO 8-P phosphatase)
MNEELIREKCRNIKIIAMDVDGTLTDCSVYYSKNGEELKRFSIRDGMGIELARLNNIKPAIITSESSEIVKSRALKLKIKDVILGSRKKDISIKELSGKYDVSLNEIAFIGDDVNDIPAIEEVGFSACPADAHYLVKEKVNYICKNNSGNGAVRELIELILKFQDKSLYLPENW